LGWFTFGVYLPSGFWVKVLLNTDYSIPSKKAEEERRMNTKTKVLIGTLVVLIVTVPFLANVAAVEASGGTTGLTLREKLAV